MTRRRMAPCPPGPRLTALFCPLPRPRGPSATLLLLALWGWVAAVGEGQGTLTCGTKFSDLASSAVMAPLVLQGHVQYLHPVTSSAGAQQRVPVTSGREALYQARVRVEKLFKGKELLNDQNGTGSDVMVESLGEVEDREECVGEVKTDQSYLFFLKPQSLLALGLELPSVSTIPSSSSSSLSSSSSSAFTSPPSSIPTSPSVGVSTAAEMDTENRTLTFPSVFVLAALPQHMDDQAIRTVEGALCTGCTALPIIRDVRCKNCATAPVLKRPMSAKESKTMRAGRRLALRCAARGTPRPSYTWLKDGRVVHHSSDGERGGGGKGVSIFKDGGVTIRYSRQFSVLVVSQMTSADAGTYSCLAANPMGEVVQTVEVKVKGSPTTPSRPPLPPPTAAPSPSHLADELDLSNCSQPPCDANGPWSSSSSTRDTGRDVAENPCDLNPCHNGGSCVWDQVGAGRARCQCLPDYHGNTCQFRRRTVRVDERERNDHSYEKDDDDDNGSLLPEADSHRDVTNPLPLGSSASSNDNNGDDNITTTAAPPANAAERISGNATALGSQHSVTRRLRKKLSRKHGSSSGGGYGPRKPKTLRTGAPKLKVSECPEQGYCLNGGTCKIVEQLQRRFCECIVGYVGRRCERAV